MKEIIYTYLLEFLQNLFAPLDRPGNLAVVTILLYRKLWKSKTVFSERL